MKKTITILAMSLFSAITFAQSGLKITSSIATNKGMKTNVTVKFTEFYLNNKLQSQFNVETFINETEAIIAYTNTGVIGGVYNFKLASIPNITIMWDSVKVRLQHQGLTVVTLP